MNQEKENSELLIKNLAEVFKDVDNLNDKDIQHSIDDIKKKTIKIDESNQKAK